MATKLATPITVTSGPFSANATHEQYGATIQPWNGPPDIYLIACNVEVDGALIPVNGLRSDTKKVSPTHARPTEAEWTTLSGDAKWQAALAMAAELHRYIVSDRDPALKPAWLP
jgi:hypothetical protein